jgi:hypothetical protein
VGSRRYKRIKTHLPGVYQHLETTQQSGQIVVENLSFGGIWFCTPEPPPIVRDDRLRLSFTLDDPSQTNIVEQVRVRFVRDSTIGAAFLNAEMLQPALAAYVMRS